MSKLEADLENFWQGLALPTLVFRSRRNLVEGVCASLLGSDQTLVLEVADMFQRVTETQAHTRTDIVQ